jgi:hypothetical protein
MLIVKELVAVAKTPPEPSNAVIFNLYVFAAVAFAGICPFMKVI